MIILRPESHLNVTEAVSRAPGIEAEQKESEKAPSLTRTPALSPRPGSQGQDRCRRSASGWGGHSLTCSGLAVSPNQLSPGRQAGGLSPQTLTEPVSRYLEITKEDTVHLSFS